MCCGLFQIVVIVPFINTSLGTVYAVAVSMLCGPDQTLLINVFSLKDSNVTYLVSMHPI